MAFYVYVLQSGKDSSFYKGFTEDPVRRVQMHNEGFSSYTRSKTPWKLVYAEEMDDKKSALLREKALKKYGHSQIEQLIVSAKNIATRFIDPE